ncbi:MAG: ribonuclease J [Rhizobiales bacterium]|nr:ribonuclease J [Hyphomicrobiales bacterium]NRB12852.1 ribonuclease J [Hyphomicrobiales bacterium]
MNSPIKEFLYVPLGGVGEIGMNMYLYGFGSGKNRKWIMVDCGIAFADDTQPGIESIMPDTAFIENELDNLLGIFITHAHEDHQGGLDKIWPLLDAPVYGTPFSTNLIARKLAETDFGNDVELINVEQGETVKLGPFSIEFIPVTHSIPEANALAITTELGTIIHTGDWKLDNNPVIGKQTDVARLQELGESGVLALVGDSTNVFRTGKSPTEFEVGQGIEQAIKDATGCIAITSFASNAARVYSIIKAAQAANKKIVIAGRSLWRIIDIAREEGYFDDLPKLYDQNDFSGLKHNNIVVIVTGTQGESRAALARIAKGEHPAIKLRANDTVIFSSTVIPGNEKAVGQIINALASADINIITSKTHKVHVTGHPLRDELIQMYGWVKPQVAIPVHGEAAHVREHMKLATSLGVKTVIKAHNGTMVRLAPGKAKTIGEVEHGRIYEDGKLLTPAWDGPVKERRKLSFVGIVTISVVFDRSGKLRAEPEIFAMGLPEYDDDGASMFDLIADKLDEILDAMPKGIRKQEKAASESLRIGVRRQIERVWGKKTNVQIMLSYVN